MNLSSLFESLTERIVVAFVAAVASALTLLLFPIAILILGSGGGGEMEIGVVIYSFVFSGFGLFVIIGAAIVGFFVGAERMSNMFGFFWGTHKFWAAFGAYLDDKTGPLQSEYNVPAWLLVILLAIFVSVIFIYYA